MDRRSRSGALTGVETDRARVIRTANVGEVSASVWQLQDVAACASVCASCPGERVQCLSRNESSRSDAEAILSGGRAGRDCCAVVFLKLRRFQSQIWRTGATGWSGSKRGCGLGRHEVRGAGAVVTGAADAGGVRRHGTSTGSAVGNRCRSLSTHVRLLRLLLQRERSLTPALFGLRRSPAGPGHVVVHGR